MEYQNRLFKEICDRLLTCDIEHVSATNINGMYLNSAFTWIHN